jgi:hypothetical protein
MKGKALIGRTGFIVGATLLSSCAYLLQYDDDPATPIRSVRVPAFTCDCPDKIVAEAVRNVFIIELTQAGEVQAVKEGPADVVLEGTITIGNVANPAATQDSVPGHYVSGITVLAYRDRELVASRAFGQSWNRRRLLSPETVAQVAARSLAEALYEKGLKPR